MALLASLGASTGLGVPVVVGLSREPVLGRLTGRSAGDRLPGSLAAALVAVRRGASVVRVHDAAARDIVAVRDAVRTGVTVP
ncbi:dihydropteroate synthase [Geodermatophilus sp. SYSU D00867]